VKHPNTIMVITKPVGVNYCVIIVVGVHTISIEDNARVDGTHGLDQRTSGASDQEC
jgi:hypothetical protein